MFDNFQPKDLTEEYVIPWGINIVMALLVFIVGRFVVKILVGVLRKVLAKSHMDEMLINFVASIINAVLMLFVIIAALEQLGVDTTSFVALLGAAGLAIGLSLQGSLQNFSSGVMIVMFKPFELGDFVEAGGVTGVIEKISIFNTVMKTPDNREIIIPNGKIYGDVIVNYSAKETRRVDLVFGIGYGDDIKRAKEILVSILDADDRVLKDPAAVVAVGELADSSVNFNVRPWVKAADYWDVRSDLLERVKLTFDENEISIPYPQMDVHVDKTY